MKENIINSTVCVLLFIFFSYAHSQTQKENVSDEIIKVRIRWEEVENAVGYRILIRNSEGKVIVDSAAESNSLELEIPAGEYTMRIGVVNKFYKIGSWSDWASITFTKALSAPTKPDKTERKYTPFKIGAGFSYFYILSDFNKVLDNSYISGNLALSYGLGKLIPFRFFRFIGFEAESFYVMFEGQKTENGTKINKTDILAGGNIYFTTAFNSPVNLILRAGGGVAFARLEYQNIDGAGTDVKLESQDPYYKVGTAIEITPMSHFFIETGADYYTIMYIGKNFNTLAFFARIGIRF